jgi:hypothetical protein
MAEVIRRGTVIPLGEYASLTLPYRQPIPVGFWVGESHAIPVTALTLSKATLGPPKKIGVITLFSRELAAYGNGEAIITGMLRASTAATIDAVYLSANAATADGLAGLLNGVAATTSSGNALGDLDLLARACQGTDGSGEVVYVTTPALAASLATRNDVRPGTTILASVAVPAARLIGIDPAGIVHAVNPQPDISSSEEAVFQVDSAPVDDIGTPGSPPTVAAPTQSMFQTSQIALRCLIDLCWTKWRPDAVQFIDAIAW